MDAVVTGIVIAGILVFVDEVRKWWERFRNPLRPLDRPRLGIDHHRRGGGK